MAQMQTMHVNFPDAKGKSLRHTYMYTCKESMDSWYSILGYLHLRKVGTKRQSFFNKFECHGNLHCVRK